MRKSKIRYFLGSNSSEGFASLYDDLTDPKRGEGRLIIKAGPGGGKSSFMKCIAAAMDSAGTSVEYIYCSGDPDSLDGIFIPALSLAVVDGTAPHAAEPVCYGALDQYIDLFRFCDRQALRTKVGEIMRISREYKSHYKNAYSYINSACGIYNAAVHHDNKHDRAAAHTVLDAYLPQIKGSSGRIRHRFTSAFTYKGFIDFTLDSCDGLSEIYIPG